MHILPTFTKPSHFSHSNNARVKVDKPRSRVTTEIQQKAALAAPDLPSKAAAQAAQPSDARADDDRQWKKKEIIREGFRNKTKGEAWFNTISYVGIGYGLVTATSVFLTWLLHDTEKFSKNFGAFAKGATTKLGVPPSIANIGTLFLGGTIASVLPVKWLEDKKPEIVKKLDRMLYSDEELKDPKIKAAHQELDELPKQTWASVFSSRVVAFAATFGIFFLMGSNKSPLAKATGESIDKRSIQFGRWLDKWIHRGNPEVTAKIDTAIQTNLSKINPSLGDEALSGLEVIRDKVGGDRIASRVWSYIGLDAFYTLFTSASLYIFTRVFGGLIGKPTGDKASASTKKDKHAVAHAAPAKALADQSTVREEAPATEQPDKPSANISQPTLLERVAQPQQTAELTA